MNILPWLGSKDILLDWKHISNSPYSIHKDFSIHKDLRWLWIAEPINNEMTIYFATINRLVRINQLNTMSVLVSFHYLHSISKERENSVSTLLPEVNVWFVCSFSQGGQLWFVGWLTFSFLFSDTRWSWYLETQSVEKVCRSSLIAGIRQNLMFKFIPHGLGFVTLLFFIGLLRCGCWW